MKTSKYLVLARLWEDLPGSISRAVKLHNELLEKKCKESGVDMLYNRDYFESKWSDGDVSELDSYEVTVSWEEYARSCLVDHGTTRIPMEAICDDTYEDFINEIVSKKVENLLSEQTRRNKLQKDAEREQYEELKKKFG